MRTHTAIASALFLAAGAAVVAVPTQASADTEHCVTHDEYDRADLGMYRYRVEEIFDISGWVSWQGEATYRVSYRTCWAYDTLRIRVTYENTDNFVTAKDVVDL